MNKLIALAGIFALSMLSVTANAAPTTVYCPGTGDISDREFELTTEPGAGCLAYAPGNISGNNDAINQLGYVTLDKSDDGITGLFPNALTVTGEGTLGGTFSFTAPTGYKNFVIAIKSGNGQLDPDWAAFSLADGVISGDWGIAVGKQSMSHINLYAQVVPIPAAAWLLGSALAGLGFMRRKKIV